MRADILSPLVENVKMVVVPEKNEEGATQHYVYLLNLRLVETIRMMNFH